MRRAILERLVDLRRAGTSAAVVTHIPSGHQDLVTVSDDHSAGLDPEILTRALDAIRADRSQSIDIGNGRVFIHVFSPPLRLIIVGAVHIAEALAPAAAIAGFAVTLVDPRGAFLSRPAFQPYTRTEAWPDKALIDLHPDCRTSIVTLSHDPKLDDPALATALAGEALYVGALGSQKSHRARRERLTALGVDASDLDRIHAPVGLAIGALSPAEIAVSILAQIIEVRRSGVSRR